MDADRLISARSRSIDASGIRKAFDLARTIKNPINLSIGQPDFPVPERLKRAAINAIESDQNGYTVTQGIEPLRERIARHLAWDLGWKGAGDQGGPGLMISSGTSGSLLLAMLALLDPGDEIVIPDPYFVMYPHVAKMCGGKAVLCDTYPDFRMTAERVEPLINERTKAVLFNSPSNPCGTVPSRRDCEELLDLCRRKGVLLISDEIYDEFAYPEAMTDTATAEPKAPRIPSPARLAGASEDLLLIRGFGKTFGCTGWRMGYAAGPKGLIEQMLKLQQYTFVCAPSIAQWGCIDALDIDMSDHIAEYKRRRDLVIEKLGEHTEIAVPGGAFYAFPKVPDRLGLTATEFIERAIKERVIIIPGSIFSARDTHFRVSYATRPEMLEEGIDILARLLAG